MATQTRLGQSWYSLPYQWLAHGWLYDPSLAKHSWLPYLSDWLKDEHVTQDQLIPLL